MKNSSVERIISGQSLIDQAKSNIGALTQHAIDRDELLRMLRTTEDRLWTLKRRMPTRRKLSTKSGSYAKAIEKHESLVELLRKTISAHEETLLVSKGTKTQRTLAQVLGFLTECINKLCGMWHVLEKWYKGARNLLTEIKLNAENLRQHKFAGA